METMKILVTGGSAFIGSTISDSLSTKYKVISPTSQQLNLLNASDVKDYLNKNSFDIVIHSANHLVHPLLKESKEPSIQLVNNLKMFFNIAINKNLFGKMIYFGSGAEFGRENWKSKMKESYFADHYPADQYGLSKYFMNIHTRLSKDIYNLRLFGMYGTKDDWRFRFIPYICATFYEISQLKGSIKKRLLLTRIGEIFNSSTFKFTDPIIISDFIQLILPKRLFIEMLKKVLSPELAATPKSKAKPAPEVAEVIVVAVRIFRDTLLVEIEELENSVEIQFNPFKYFTAPPK